MSTPFVSGAGSNEQLSNTLNSAIRDVNAMQEVQVFKDDTGTRRVLLGRGADGFYGLRVSKPGFDVYDTPDTNMIFDSDRNVLKVSQSGTIALTATAGSGASANITHNLGFRPQVIMNAVTPAGPQSVPIPYLANISSATLYVNAGIIAIDESVVTVNVDLGASATGIQGVWVFTYYLLQETAN